MDRNIRDNAFEEYQNILNGCIKRNLPLIIALQLEVEDVVQQLSIRMLRAIERFDSDRFPSLPGFLYHELQYEILDIRRKHKPLGLVGVPQDQRVEVVYIDQARDDGTMFDLPTTGDFGICELTDAIYALPIEERKATIRKMSGEPIRKRAERMHLVQACKTLAILGMCSLRYECARLRLR